MKQLRKVQRSCTRDSVEADESYFVLNPADDWQPVETECKGVMWEGLGALQMRQAEQLITL